MKINPARVTTGYPATTSVQAKRGEAGIAQDRAMLSQKPGTATALEGGIASAVSPSVPLWTCLCGAANRFRDHVCRSCGDHRPDWKEGEDCDATD